MTKTVFSNAMVAHVWAQQEQEYGRNGKGTFYFRDATIYSYCDDYPVGNFVDCPDGARAVLLWSGSYSVTASSHQSLARRAVRGTRAFTVPDLLTDTCGQEAPAADNLTYLAERVSGAIEEVKRAAGDPRMYSREYLFDTIPSLVEDVRAYARAFRLRIPSPACGFNLDRLRSEVDTIKRDREAAAERARARLFGRFNGDHAAVEQYHERKRILSRAVRLRGIDLYGRYNPARAILAELSELVDRDPGDTTARGHADRINRILGDHTEAVECRAAERRERERQWQLEREARKAAFRELTSADQEQQCAAGEAPWSWLSDVHRVDLWLAGNPAIAARHLRHAREALLRISPRDPATVETSLGADFPAEHARRAWSILRAIYARGIEWNTNGKTIPLGHFKVSHVSSDGTITAGCHRVKRVEAERFAVEVLGLAPVPDEV